MSDIINVKRYRHWESHPRSQLRFIKTYILSWLTKISLHTAFSPKIFQIFVRSEASNEGFESETWNLKSWVCTWRFWITDYRESWSLGCWSLWSQCFRPESQPGSRVQFRRSKITESKSCNLRIVKVSLQFQSHGPSSPIEILLPTLPVQDHRVRPCGSPCDSSRGVLEETLIPGFPRLLFQCGKQWISWFPPGLLDDPGRVSQLSDFRILDSDLTNTVLKILPSAIFDAVPRTTETLSREQVVPLLSFRRRMMKNSQAFDTALSLHLGSFLFHFTRWDTLHSHIMNKRYSSAF